MIGDHRRILATGIARVRAKIKYNPVAFELMPAAFTLLQLQRCVEAISGLKVEVDSLSQLEEALAERADAILLDNMSLDDLRRGVAMIGGRAISEASGRVTPDTAASIAETGVDLISVGRLTHSAPILDIGLDATD